MKLILKSLILGMLLLSLFAVCSAEDQSDYILDTGDTLKVFIRDIEGLQNIEVFVREDGYISFPYAGDVYVRGKTISEARGILESKLLSYLKAPDVVIILAHPRKIAIGIIGAVHTPGDYLIPSTSTILEALSFSGGPILEDARLGGVRIYKKDGTMIKVNLRKVLNDPSSAKNYIIENGDVIFIPRRFISWKFESLLQILSIVTITIGIQEALKD